MGGNDFALEIPNGDKSLERLLSIYDCRGNGNGDVSCTITGDHQNRITDYTAVVVQASGFNGHKSISGTIQYQDETAPTLERNMPSNILAVYPDMARTLVAWGDSSPCVDRGQNVVCVASVNQNASGEVRMSDMAYTLSTNSNVSGRNAPLVFVCKTANTKSNGLGVREDTSYTLDSSQNQAILSIGIGEEINASIELMETLLSHTSGGSRQCIACYSASGYGTYTEGIGVLKAQGGDCGGGSENLAVVNLVVRRLTPKECERLQAFPDNWTACGYDGKSISDTARYRALGNSITTSVTDWVFGNIVRSMES